MSFPRHLYLWLAVALVFGWALAWRNYRPTRSAPLAIAADTSFLETPLVNGRIDYLAAVHNRWPSDLRDGENGAVQLALLLGPPGWRLADLPSLEFPWQSRFEAARSEAVLQSFRQFASDSADPDPAPGEDEADDSPTDLQRALTPTCAGAAEPDIDRWVAASTAALDRAADIARLPFAQPVARIAGHGNIVALPYGNISDLLAALARRATVAAASDPTLALTDLETLLLLARRLVESPEILHVVYGLNADRLGRSTAANIAVHELAPDALTAMDALLAQHPRLSPGVDSLDWMSRVRVLDGLQLQQSRQLPPFWIGVAQFDVLCRRYAPDLTRLCRLVNARVDEIVGALRLTAYGERRQALVQLDEAMVAALKITENPFDGLRPTAADKQAFLERLTATGTTRYFISRAEALSDMQVAADTRQALLAVILALQHYREDRRKLPISLAQLVPAYLDQLPSDPYSGDALCLLRNENCFLVYSVGQDLTDNGAQAQADIVIGWRFE